MKKFSILIHVFFMTTSVWSQNEFITTWQTTTAGESITIPTFSGETYNYDVDWGDGMTSTSETGNATHSYTTVGNYQVSITGVFPRIYFNFSGDRLKIKSIDQWGTQQWTSMDKAFRGCENLNGPISDNPDLSSVTTMNQMFDYCKSFNQDVGSWDVSNVTNMSGLFLTCNAFNQDIGAWNVANVTSMKQMFQSNTVFNQDIGNWNVSQVTDMTWMFKLASVFNQDIGNWDVGDVTNMYEMFNNTTQFNQDISGWDVSNVTSMVRMFNGPLVFNQDLGSWDVSNVTNMYQMFYNSGLSTDNYDGLLNGWSLLSLKPNVNFHAGSSEYCYGGNSRTAIVDQFSWTITDGGEDPTCTCSSPIATTYISSNNCPVEEFFITVDVTGLGSATTVDITNNGGANSLNGVGLGSYSIGPFSASQVVTVTVANSTDLPCYSAYPTSTPAACHTTADYFITSWTTTVSDETVTIPIYTFGGLVYNYDVDWGDGVVTAGHNGDASHIFATSGIYTISIAGDFPRIFFNNGGDKTKINSIDQWGPISWTSMSRAFQGCSNLAGQATDEPDLTLVTDLTAMFANCGIFNQDISSWDVSNVTILKDMLAGTSSFDRDISNWDISSVTTLRGMFGGTTAFNQNIGSWNVENVNTALGMFGSGSALSVANYDALLIGWESQNLQSNVVIHGGTNSEYCTGTNARKNIINNFGWSIYDGGIDPACTDPSIYFKTTWQTTSANESVTIPTSGSGYNYIVDWGDGNMTMNHTGNATHPYAVAGNYQISISGTFPRIYFNNSGDKTKIISIDQWGANKWFSMEKAFWGCSNLAGQASDVPDLSYGSLSNLSSMFNGCSSFNQDISNWNVSNITNMNSMFNNASLFNNDISDWDVSNVTDMRGVFSGAVSFNQDISGWDVSKVYWMDYMFQDATNFNQDIGQWNLVVVTNLREMFKNATSFNQDISGWDVSGIYNMYSMFEGATSFNQDISGWDVSSVSQIYQMFKNATAFNQGIDGWVYGSVTNLRYMFQGATSFNQDLSSWDVSNVTRMEGMFQNATAFNQDVGNWNVSSVTDMSSMFNGATSFDANLASWDVSSVTEMDLMFFGASTFNQDISTWNTSSITNMIAMFSHASLFNQDIGVWDVSSVTDMRQMFNNAINFNHNIGLWNISNVTDTRLMFDGASAFNQDISSWDVSNVTLMFLMFRNALSFDQNLSGWDVSNVTNMLNMFNGATLSTSNYDALLIGWSALSLKPNVNFHGGNSEYCDPAAVTAKANIISSFNWSFTDGGEVCPVDPTDYFITTWRTTTANESITIPTSGGGYNYDVDWGDGNTSSNQTGNTSHTYSIAGDYQVKISGNFPTIYFAGNAVSRNKIISVDQWGTQVWTTKYNSFRGCSNLEGQATDLPDLSMGPSLFFTFSDCPLFNQDVSNWDVSNITNMSYTFFNASTFNQDLSSWDVGNVTSIASMFGGASSFNQNIGGWSTSNISSLNGTFSGASSFNQDISGWDVTNVINMGVLFKNASSFDQNIGTWTTSSATNMNGIFNNATLFNQDIGSWDVSNVGNMSFAFNNATAFDQNLENWDISSVTNTSGMFENATLSTANYDALLIGWNALNLQPNLIFHGGNSTYCTGETARDNMINNDGWTINDGGKEIGCGLVDADYFKTTWQTTTANEEVNTPYTGGYLNNYIVHWGDGSSSIGGNAILSHIYVAPGTYQMIIIGDFKSVSIRILDKSKLVSIDQWGTQVWKSINFADCINLNGMDTNAPDLSQITSLYATFKGATSFNQDINNWDVSNVTTMQDMFRSATSFNQNLNDWDVSNVTIMWDMFLFASDFNGNISSWDVSSVTNMNEMFNGASAFNQDISGWNVSNTQAMSSMFRNASSFNQDISGWTTTSLIQTSTMFQNASSFDQNIGSWDMSNVISTTNMFVLTTLSTANFDAILTGWDAQNLQPNLSFHGGNSKYCAGETARIHMEESVANGGDNWNISDGGLDPTCYPCTEPVFTLSDGTDNCPNPGTEFYIDVDITNTGSATTINILNNGGAPAINGVDGTASPYSVGPFTSSTTVDITVEDANDSACNDVASHTTLSCPIAPFITTWQTTTANEWLHFYIGGGSFTVDWGDGNTTNHIGSFASINHQYVTPGNHTVTISGTTLHFSFVNSTPTNSGKLLSVDQWGGIIWTHINFDRCANMHMPASDAPDLSSITSTANMFVFANAFNESIDHWDVSNITNMSYMFLDAPAYNQPLNSWDVSNVTNMEGMFHSASAFDQDINGWDVANVTYMHGMFRGANSFNGNISSWNVANVTNMIFMFMQASDFDQNIGSWNVSSVTDMNRMFSQATSFNQDIGSWDVTNVTTMQNMFNFVTLSTTNYDALLTGWDAQNLQPNVVFSGGNSTFCNGEAARTHMMETTGNGGDGWTITDGGLEVSCNPPSGCDELMISEYVEGSGNNKYLELYNPTNASISLDEYSIAKYVNGSSGNVSTLALTGYHIASDGVFVIAHPNASAWSGTPDVTHTGVMTFNGNDPIALRKNGANVDLIGVIGSSVDFVEDVTLVRKATISSPNTTYDVSEWDSYAQDEVSYLGSHINNDCPALNCTVLSYPPNGLVNLPVNTNISWYAVTGATGYKITAGSTSGGHEYFNNIDVGSQNFYDPSLLFDYNSTVYVTVTPYDAIGDAMGCTEESFSTTIERAFMTFPVPNSTNVAITEDISWNTVTDATGYRISISSSPGAFDIVTNVDVGLVTTYDPSSDFEYGTTVFVLITAYFGPGDAQGSAEKYFTTTAQPNYPCEVVNTDDSGVGSLRHAIICANVNAGPDTITFNISGVEADTISLLSFLPNISGDSTIIDGTTETGNYPMNRKILIDQSALNVGNNKSIIVTGKYSQIYGLEFQNTSQSNNHLAIVYATGADHFTLGGKNKGNYFSERFAAVTTTGSNVNYGVIEGNIFDGTNGDMKTAIIISSGSNHVTIGGDSIWQENSFIKCYSDAVRLLNYANHNEVKNNYFKYNNRAIYNKGIHLNGYNLGNNFIGNSFICNDTAIINTVGGNQDILPPVIDLAKVNFVSGTANPGSVVEVYMSKDTCTSAISQCGGEHSIGRDTCAADGKFFVLLDVPYFLAIGDKVAAIQTDTLVNGSSEFTSCVTVDSTCVDFVYACYDNTIGSLRSAVECAADGDTIYFLSYLMGDNIALEQSLIIDKNLAIVGLGNPGTAVVSTAGTYSIQIASGKQVTIMDLSLCVTNSASTSIIDNFGATTLENITIIDKRTGQPLPTIVNKTGATLNIKQLVEVIQN